MPPKGYNKQEEDRSLDDIARNIRKQKILDNIRGASENQQYWMNELRKILKEEEEAIKNKKRKGKQE